MQLVHSSYNVSCSLTVPLIPTKHNKIPTTAISSFIPLVHKIPSPTLPPQQPQVSSPHIPNISSPHGRVSIGCKLVLRVKENPDGSTNKYKSRLVAKGFHQRYGDDYTETFSPVIKPVTVRPILTLVLSQGWKLKQLGVNNAFLNLLVLSPKTNFQTGT